MENPTLITHAQKVLVTCRIGQQVNRSLRSHINVLHGRGRRPSQLRSAAIDQISAGTDHLQERVCMRQVSGPISRRPTTDPDHLRPIIWQRPDRTGFNRFLFQTNVINWSAFQTVQAPTLRVPLTVRSEVPSTGHPTGILGRVLG